ncbi:MAG: alpha-L-fucosidase [Oscillospiraceae bacterium]|nr:alpha-L-fucosidase [Oscillospiraceae bacterium]
MPNKIKDYLKKIDEVNANGEYKDVNDLKDYPYPKWFADAKLGVFIHWGVYTVPEYLNEWYPRHMYYKGSPINGYHIETYGRKFNYRDFIPMFTAPRFDPREWLGLFKESGARFVMPVAEHHDGFKMYESDINEWNSVNMGPKRDVLGELKAACEEKGLAFCASSHRAEHYWFMNGGKTLRYDNEVKSGEYPDFYGPAENLYKSNNWMMLNKNEKNIVPSREWLEDWLVSSCELIDRYRPSALFFDWWICHCEEFYPYTDRFLTYYCNRSREWGTDADGRKDVCIFYKSDRIPLPPVVLDQERGQLGDIYGKPWQCETSTAKNSWSYTVQNQFKSPEEIICNFIDVLSKNGTFCINIGPRADGSICDRDINILKQLGRFTKLNGEAIWDVSTYKVFGEGKERQGGMFRENYGYSEGEFRFTQKGGAVYVFALVPSKNGEYNIKTLASGKGRLEKEIKSVSLLGYDAKVSYNVAENALRLTAPNPPEDALPLCFKIIC